MHTSHSQRDLEQLTNTVWQTPFNSLQLNSENLVPTISASENVFKKGGAKPAITLYSQRGYQIKPLCRNGLKSLILTKLRPICSLGVSNQLRHLEVTTPVQKFFFMLPTVVKLELILYKRLFLTAGVTQLRHLLKAPVLAQRDL